MATTITSRRTIVSNRLFEVEQDAAFAYVHDRARREAKGFDFAKLLQDFLGPILKDVPDCDSFLT